MAEGSGLVVGVAVAVALFSTVWYCVALMWHCDHFGSLQSSDSYSSFTMDHKLVVCKQTSGQQQQKARPLSCFHSEKTT